MGRSTNGGHRDNVRGGSNGGGKNSGSYRYALNHYRSWKMGHVVGTERALAVSQVKIRRRYQAEMEQLARRHDDLLDAYYKLEGELKQRVEQLQAVNEQLKRAVTANRFTYSALDMAVRRFGEPAKRDDRDGRVIAWSLDLSQDAAAAIERGDRTKIAVSPDWHVVVTMEV